MRCCACPLQEHGAGGCATRVTSHSVAAGHRRTAALSTAYGGRGAHHHRHDHAVEPTLPQACDTQEALPGYG